MTRISQVKVFLIIDLLKEDTLKLKNITKFEEKKHENKTNPLKSVLSSKDNKEVKVNKNINETKQLKENVFTPFPDFQTQNTTKLKDIFSHPNNTSKKISQIPKKKGTLGGLTSNKEKYQEMFPEL
jgi:hypothetical protein